MTVDGIEDRPSAYDNHQGCQHYSHDAEPHVPANTLDGYQNRLDDKQYYPAYEKRSVHMYKRIRQFSEDHPAREVALSKSNDDRREDQHHHGEKEHILTRQLLGCHR